MSDLRVLVVGTSSPHVANYINRIQSEDVSIFVVSNGNEFLSKDMAYRQVDFSLVNPLNWLRTTWAISKVIRSFKPTVIHVHQANAVAFYVTLVNVFFNLPLVLTAWGSDILINPKQNWLLKKMIQFVLKRVDHSTADAQFLADEMQRLIPTHKLAVTIVNFGVNPINLSVEKEKIIYSNRTHNKLYRIDQVIDGFKRFCLSENSVGWKLIIAGRGTETEQLKAQCVESGLSDRIEFVGFLSPEQNANYYARSTFFVSLPESDATAVSLLEAMYYKCVPIVSDLPANKEWITHGVNGFVVTDLSGNYIEDALNIDRESAGQLNNEIVLEKGTLEVSKASFRKVIFEAVQKSKDNN